MSDFPECYILDPQDLFSDLEMALYSRAQYLWN